MIQMPSPEDPRFLGYYKTPFSLLATSTSRRALSSLALRGPIGGHEAPEQTKALLDDARLESHGLLETSAALRCHAIQ